jgi:RNA polymerase sigma factor (sigma-70 family)
VVRAGADAPRRAIITRESDSHLLELAREGDERAFDAIFERYRGPLLASTRRIVDDAAAQDAVQQAFVSAWYALRRGHEVRQLRPWLFTIARRAALERLRSELPTDQLTEAHRDSRTTQELVEQSARARAALAVVADLPDRERDALVWTSLQGRSGREAARALGVSEGAVRQLLVRGRARARTALGVLTPPAILARLSATHLPRRLASPGQGPLVGAGALEATPALAWLAPVLAAGVLAGGGVSAGGSQAGQPAHDPASAASSSASSGHTAAATAGPRPGLGRTREEPRRPQALAPAAGGAHAEGDVAPGTDTDTVGGVPSTGAGVPSARALTAPAPAHGPEDPSRGELGGGRTVTTVTEPARGRVGPTQGLPRSPAPTPVLPAVQPPAEAVASGLIPQAGSAAAPAQGAGQALVGDVEGVVERAVPGL